MQQSGLALSRADAKNEAFCKLYCIKNFPQCITLDWDAESGCTVHYTGAYGPLLFSSGTIHWKIETVPCEGMISGKCNVEYKIYYWLLEEMHDAWNWVATFDCTRRRQRVGCRFQFLGDAKVIDKPEFSLLCYDIGNAAFRPYGDYWFCGYTFVLKGACIGWTRIPEILLIPDIRKPYSTEKACKNGCISEDFACESVSWISDNKHCLHHYVGAFERNITYPSSVFWQMKRRPCKGIVCPEKELFKLVWNLNSY